VGTPALHMSRSGFTRDGVAAHGLGATQTRIEFSTWLQRHFAPAGDRLNDVVLAVYEALANAAEFAYLDSSGSATMDLQAAYDLESDTLTVTVSDQGRWHEPVPNPGGADSFQLRGRGIPLMRALADMATIDPTSGGTLVTLVWSKLLDRGRR
jgi:serine/threonine-protein kinase RsbW